ncbi:MAG: aspartate aminotransferase family protein [Clostridia bacterium]|nr:aspartate aminotransferase family protein [Clostridia bacterium]
MDDDKQYIANTYGRFPLAVARAKGSLMWDISGKEYIDMGSGIAVSSLGISDDAWQQAVSQQAATLSHTSNLYYNEPQVVLARMLCQKTGMSKVFFANSGAEANECAIKAARKYSFDKYGTGRHTIVTLQNSFHGRTMATITATGQDTFHTYFDPFLEGFVYVKANDFTQLQEAVKAHSCCAIMLEPVQGEGGVNPLDGDYVRKVRELCTEQDLLLIIDEVQTGNGRSGTYFAYEQFGITPDIVTTAKGLAGGLPMGAALLGEKLKETLGAGSHGSTFGGNPVCAAGAVSIVSRIDDALLSEVRAKSEYIRSELSNAKGVRSVSGMGLMLGIETEKDAKALVNALLARGVVVLTAKTKVRLLPALNIPWELLKKAVSIMKEEFAK